MSLSSPSRSSKGGSRARDTEWPKSPCPPAELHPCQDAPMPWVRQGLPTQIHWERSKWALLNPGQPKNGIACAIPLAQAHPEPVASPWLSPAPLSRGDSVMQENGFGVGACPAKLFKHSPRKEECGGTAKIAQGCCSQLSILRASQVPGIWAGTSSQGCPRARGSARLAGTECAALPEPYRLCWGLGQQRPWGSSNPSQKGL